MSMELDDLFKEEGLDAAGVEDALAWARRRAAELVRDVDGDPELGPLLGGARVVGATEGPRATASARPASPPGLEERPLFTDLRGLQAAFLAEADDEDADLPEVGAVLRAFQKGKGRSGSGPVRSASATTTKPRLSLDGDAGPAASFGLDELRAEARSDAEREPVEAAPQSTAAAMADGAAMSDALDERAVAKDDDAAPSDERAAAELHADTTLPAAAAATEATAEADTSEPTTADAPREAASEHGVPAPPEADLDPLAGIDFDDLPGVDEDDEEDDHTHVDLPSPGLVAAAADMEGRTTMIPTDGADMTLPSMQAPLAEPGLGRSRQGGSLPAGELTERSLNPLIPPEPSGDVTVTAMAPNPLGGASPETSITDVPTSAKVEAAPADESRASQEPEEPADEIELLDDEDLLLMEEEPEEEPEWKQALKSVEGKDGGEDDS